MFNIVYNIVCNIICTIESQYCYIVLHCNKDTRCTHCAKKYNLIQRCTKFYNIGTNITGFGCRFTWIFPLNITRVTNWWTSIMFSWTHWNYKLMDLELWELNSGSSGLRSLSSSPNSARTQMRPHDPSTPPHPTLGLGRVVWTTPHDHADQRGQGHWHSAAATFGGPLAASRR